MDDPIEHVEFIEIFGGEPMLIKQQFKFRKASRTWLIKNTVSYATNGTIFPENAVKMVRIHFKRIIIMLSADGIKKGFEYSRYPYKRQYMENTLQRVCRRRHYTYYKLWCKCL